MKIFILGLFLGLTFGLTSRAEVELYPEADQYLYGPLHGADPYEMNLPGLLDDGINEGPKEYKTPTVALRPEDYPIFADDLNFKNMDAVIKRQLDHWSKAPSQGTIQFGDKVYPLSEVAGTLTSFLQLSKKARNCVRYSFYSRSKQRRCVDKFNQLVREKFDVYAPDLKPEDPRFGQPEWAFYTAYYTPTLPAVRKKDAKNQWGIYLRPKEENLRTSTRVQIQFDHVLEETPYPVFYTNDIFDLYILHVQGGGKLLVDENGKKTPYYIYYDGSNGHPFKFIYKYMAEKGYIKEKALEVQHEFILAHPELQREIFETCPSFVYYRLGDSNPPPGSGGVSLTPGRSIATDKNFYKYKGVLAFVEAKRPTEKSAKKKGKPEFKNFSRFMLDQDTGSAILGKARADLYHGEDKYAEKAAYNTQHTGRIFYLMRK